MGPGTMIIHLDAVGGVAGDMFVAALLDAFPDLTAQVMADVAAVLPQGTGTARLTPGFSAGMRCLRFGLEPGAAGQHHHHDEHHHHGARYSDLCALIAGAPLSPGTADHALAILTILARAEAHIHGVAVDDVHFHEVGDWDSLMDVVAAGSIAAALSPVRWTVSDLPRGGGLVRAAHGMLPVPAPATLAILPGFAWRDDGTTGERVTPTGAAILRHLCQPGGPGALGALVASGTGAGTRDLADLPNVLRVSVFAPAPDTARDMVEIVTFDIDDMTGEEIGHATHHLRAGAGVIDLTSQTLQGKKGRPFTRFEILATPGSREGLATLIFSETSTLGLRVRSEARLTLAREQATAAGLRVKHATRPGGTRTTKAEADDLAPMPGLANRRATARAAETADDKDE
ncbi:MAG: LarC family nickel insertion protein [Paracoccaceae bacterium]|nr:MAG: LarC family nickel insertion protein [Paracoccaceae bacterium]